MAYVDMNGSMLVDIVDTLIELSPVHKKGMAELTTDMMNKWDARRLNRQLKTCGGRIFYRAHPELIGFLQSFPFKRTYKPGEKYVSFCPMDPGCSIASVVLEHINRTCNLDLGYLGRYFNNSSDGWVMVGARPPDSPMMPYMLADHLGKFKTHVMGLPDRRIREITKAILDDHYIHFTMYDRKGRFNSLMTLLPAIADILNKPGFPTPEIAELCARE